MLRVTASAGIWSSSAINTMPLFSVRRESEGNLKMAHLDCCAEADFHLGILSAEK
jgi:hypothetical protein